MPNSRNFNQGYMALRWEVLERDEFTCQYCGQHAPDVKLEVDHVLPVIDGGKDEASNLKTSCYACNRGRSALKIIVKHRGKSREFNSKIYPYMPKNISLKRVSQVLSLLEKQPMSAQQIAKELNIKTTNAYMIVSRVKHQNLIVREGKTWKLARA